jgi:hypothetical protein
MPATDRNEGPDIPWCRASLDRSGITDYQPRYVDGLWLLHLRPG